MDKEILRELERKLKRMHKALSSDINTLGKEIREQVLPQDSEEAINVRQESEILEEEDRLEEVEINQVEEALDRISAGTYGKCLVCGCSIPIERLKVLPYAKYCIECQCAKEKNQR